MKRFNISISTFCQWLVIVFLIGLAFGYGWRMIQIQSNELKAYEAGWRGCEEDFKYQLHKHHKGVIFWYGNIRVVPTADGKYIVEVKE